MLNLDKYTKLKKAREDNKKKCYKKVLKQIINDVETVMIQDVDFIVFEVEPFIFGETEYNMLECVDYVINKIKKDKNFIKIIEHISFNEPNLLYIKWNLSKVA
jgi:hypothetical protein